MSETPDSPASPRVFISYSHDDKDHKTWVTTFATRLRDNGVDVVLDQWDTEPGDDMAKFMERSVRESDRVLMVCTEKYVRKVDDGKGGAGYEAMIVSAELIADQGMNKFIPVVRQTAKDRTVPISLGTRKYIDLSADREDEEDQFSELLKSIHRVLKASKPPLGKNPFQSNDATAAIEEERLDLARQFNVNSTDPAQFHATATSLIRSQDAIGWKKLVQTVLRENESRFLKWKQERQPSCPHSFDARNPQPNWEFFGEGLACYDPLLACLLAAAESGDPTFSGQLSWVDLVLEPKGWVRSGPTVWTELPRTVFYYLHSVVGAMQMRSLAADQSVRLSTTPIPDPWSRSESAPIFLSRSVNGWQETFGSYCTASWGFLYSISARSPWLTAVFGSEESFKAGLSAYHMLMSYLEFVRDATRGEWTFDPAKSNFEVSHMFVTAETRIQKDAFALLMENKATLLKILETNDLSEQRFAELWPDWVNGMKRWAISPRDGYHANWSAFPLENLSRDLFRKPFDLKGT
jgi:hypothetical protein